MANPAQELRQRAQDRWPGATVSRRGRRSIEHQHPDDPSRRMLDVSVGPIHFGDNEDQEIDTAWQETSGVWQHEMLLADYHARAKASFDGAPLVEYEDRVSGNTIAFQSRQLEYTNDRGDVQAINPPQAVSATVDDDTLTWPGAFGAGLDFEWQTQTSRLGKRLVISALSDLPTPTAQITDGGNPVLRLSWQIAYSTEHPWIDGTQWSGKNNDPVATFGVVEFRDGQGNVVFAFNASRAFDADAVEQPISTRLSRSGPNILVAVRVPWSWLQEAAYPVVVDPTIDAQVGASSDDAWQDDSGNLLTTGSGPGLLCGATGTDVYDSAARFTSISPAGTIDVAFFSIYFDSGFVADGDGPWLTKVSADDQASPPTIDETNDIASRTKTTAQVDWDISSITYDAFNDSPSIVSVIQELVDTHIVTDVMIIHSDDGSAGGDRLRYVAYDLDTAQAPKLHIEYTEVGNDQITGTSAGAATASGALTATGTLAGSSAGVATPTADLNATGALSGTSAGAATSSADLNGTGTLAGTASGSATTSGAITGDGALAGTSAGIATATGALVGTGSLAGTAAGAATTSGALAGTGGLAGTSAGVATVAGNLTDAGAATMSGTAAGTATVTGTLTATGALAGSAAGVATVAGDIAGLAPIAGTAAGTSTVAGDLNGAGALAGTASGVGLVSAELKATGALVATVEGVATVTGALTGLGIVVGSVVELADEAAYEVELADEAAYAVELDDEAAYAVELDDEAAYGVELDDEATYEVELVDVLV